MERCEAEKLIDMIVGGSRRSAMHEEYGEEDEVNESNRIVGECKDKLLAALTGSDRPEVDLHKEIMNIPVDENRMSAVIQESRSINKKHNFAVHLYNVAFRDARHAAAGIVAGRWRKVEK